MMKKILFLLLFVAAFMACSDDDKNPQPDPGKHIDMIVANEGAFTTGSAALSAIYDDGSTTLDLFQDVNSRPLGDVAQSITYIKGYYYVTLSASKKVEIIEPQTFKSVATIIFKEDVKPQFIQPISETEAIVSDLSRQIIRINIKDYSVVEYIDINETGAMNIGKMLTIGKKLFCAALGKGIGVFDTNNIKGSSMRLVEGLEGSIMQTAKLILDKNNKLWVLTTGSDKVILNCIDTETEKVVKTVDIPYVKEGDAAYVDGCITGTAWFTRMDTDRNKNKLYFYMNILREGNNQFGAIFTMDVETYKVENYRELPNLGMMYGMGISPDGDVYICDCLDYSKQRGFLREYKENGSIVSQRVGIYPRMILFTEYDK